MGLVHNHEGNTLHTFGVLERLYMDVQVLWSDVWKLWEFPITMDSVPQEVCACVRQDPNVGHLAEPILGLCSGAMVAPCVAKTSFAPGRAIR